jgi:hypothetical protein
MKKNIITIEKNLNLIRRVKLKIIRILKKKSQEKKKDIKNIMTELKSTVGLTYLSNPNKMGLLYLSGLWQHTC